MHSLFTRLTPTLVGIDIDAKGIKLLQLVKYGLQWQIKAIAYSSLPPFAIDNMKIRQWPVVLDVLSRLVKHTRTQGQMAVMALPQSSVEVKKIKVAQCAEKEYEAEIGGSLSRYFPALVDGHCFDFVKTSCKENGFQEFLVIAASYTLVNDYYKLGMEAGLRVEAMDVACYALARAVKYILLDKSQYQHIVAVWNIGEVHIHFIVFEADNILYSQCWLNEDKISHITELKRSLTEFNLLYPLAIIKILYMSGAGVYTERVSVLSSCHTAFNFTVKIVDFTQAVPWAKNIDTNLERESAAYLVCLGLALRRAVLC